MLELIMKQSDIYKLHQKYAHGKYKKEILEITWTHSLIVKNISLQIVKKLEKKYGIKTDIKLIEIGSLIHDVGVYDCFDDDYKNICEYILHGKMGYDILIEEKVSQKRAKFASTHIGVGITKEQIEKENIDLPKMDFIPISLEEEIVAYADSFHSKKPVRFNSYEKVKKHLESFDLNKGVIYERFKDKFGIPDLKELENKYKKWHKEINEQLENIK